MMESVGSKDDDNIALEPSNTFKEMIESVESKDEDNSAMDPSNNCIEDKNISDDVKASVSKLVTEDVIISKNSIKISEQGTSNEGSEPTSVSRGPSDFLTGADLIIAEENERLATLSLSGSDTQYGDEEVKEVDKELQYKKLIELLLKSQFYSKFLQKKIETDKTKKKDHKKRGRRNGKDKDSNSNPGSSIDVRKRNAKRNANQMMGIAADVISNKKFKGEQHSQDEEDAEELEDPAPKNLDTEEETTKTLPNGLVVPSSQPSLLTGASLRDYQMEGLEWLKILYENGVNGILADEMGLGKTIQVIALIAHLIEKNVRGPFLIIGPLSTLPNWLIEFERFTPDIPVLLYHGTKEQRAEARAKMQKKKSVLEKKVFPVVLTSYEYPLKDVNFLRKFEWRYIIIDEGHRIKNHESQLSKALRTYNSTNRLLLTGTPLHNSLSELWALLNFLLPEIFDNLDVFESWFNVIDLEGEKGNQLVLEEEGKKNIISTMQQILSPFMLRRVKSDVNLNLPPKKELIVYAPMTPVQLDLYRAVLDYNYKKLADKTDDDDSVTPGAKRKCTLSQKRYVFKDLQFDKNGDVADFEVSDDRKLLVVKDPENKSYAINVKLQNSAMMLRKIVNHPYLVQYPLELGTEYCRIDEDLVRTSGKLQVLDAMLQKLHSRGHKVILFSTFTTLIDILEDYLSLRDFKYFRLDGSTQLEDRRKYISEFNNNPKMFLFLISTRAGGLGINLASADTVILYDSDWNPQIDIQAQDRCHRIGQTRPVVVYRFVTAGTVDEKIVVRSAAKRKLEKMIIQKGSFNSINKAGLTRTVDLEDLKELLNSRDFHGIIHPNGFVFSDEELDELLDRSDMQDGLVPDMATGNLEARHFKEYYGYTGTIEPDKNADMRKGFGEVIDDNGIDSVLPCTPLRKPSPIKKLISS